MSIAAAPLPVPPEVTTASNGAARRPRGRPRKSAEELADGNRRGELIAAAARLFRRKGFAATTTRDIAAAAGMQSGSPFYHFESKGQLLHAVMDSGMRQALARQAAALAAVERDAPPAAAFETIAPSHDPDLAERQLRALVRNHFSVLLGPGSDFIPVMLYERRSLSPAQRNALNELKSTYEAAWVPALQTLHRHGRLGAPEPVSRLLIFGALNWTVQWYDTRRPGASLDALTDAAMALFLRPTDPHDSSKKPLE